MEKFLLRSLYGILWVITLPPLRVLYIFSYIAYLLMYYFPGYRKQIVFNNIRTSFPDISDKDVRLISKKYYRHLSQLMIESIKVMHWTPEQFQHRVVLTNPEYLNKLAEAGKNIIILAGHTGNWEWTSPLVKPFGFNLLGVYKPQANSLFNDLTIMIRKKENCYPISMRETARAVRRVHENGKPSALLLIADQIPAKPDINFWSAFLNQQTAWFTGGEKIAKKFNVPVVYMRFTKLRNGYYEGTLIPISMTPEKEAFGDITRKYISELEKTIREQPECWLWSHRRWKHQPENLSLP